MIEVPPKTQYLIFWRTSSSAYHGCSGPYLLFASYTAHSDEALRIAI